MAEPDHASWFARTWQTEDGLPNDNVNSLAQTPDGFLWVGTPLGLARFDGVTFDDISMTNFVGRANRRATRHCCKVVPVDYGWEWTVEPSWV